MDRELVAKYIILSRDKKLDYTLPMFSPDEAESILSYFNATDIYLTTCNSLQKTPCYVDKNRCLIFDTGITEYFALLNLYLENTSDNQLFDGTVLKLFAESFYLVGEFNFSELLLSGYRQYADILQAGINEHSYKYLKIQELFVLAHELAHDRQKNSDFELSSDFIREKEALLLFRETGERIITKSHSKKNADRWSEFFTSRLDDSNFTEEFVSDSLAIRAIFSVLKVDNESVYNMASAIVAAIFTQYIVASINADARYVCDFISKFNQYRGEPGAFKGEYPVEWADFGTYLVYRYGYVRFCINTICRDFGITYEDMKSIDNHTFIIGEPFKNLILMKNEASTNIIGLFYDFVTGINITRDYKEARLNSKSQFSSYAEKFSNWLLSMNKE